jgi:hypothetical protein
MGNRRNVFGSLIANEIGYRKLQKRVSEAHRTYARRLGNGNWKTCFGSLTPIRKRSCTGKRSFESLTPIRNEIGNWKNGKTHLGSLPPIGHDVGRRKPEKTCFGSRLPIHNEIGYQNRKDMFWKPSAHI